MKIAYLYSKGRLARLSAIEQKKCPTEFFYGAIELAGMGHEVTHFEVDSDTRLAALFGFLGGCISKKIMPVKMDISVLAYLFYHAKQLNRADCIVATAVNIAFCAALLSMIGVIRKPIVGIQSGLLDYQYTIMRRKITGILLMRTQVVLFGEKERRPLIDYFHLSEKDVSVSQFGVDLNFWKPSTQAGSYVFAVGNDGRRDFDTLLLAAAKLNAPVSILTDRKLNAPIPPNVTVTRGSWKGSSVSDEDLRRLYQNAACIVVPLINTLQPSGQSVTLQAAACGKPVVISKIDGIWCDKSIVDGKTVVFAKPGDSNDLAERVSGLLKDADTSRRLGEEGRKMVVESGDIRQFAEGIARACSHAVERRGHK